MSKPIKYTLIALGLIAGLLLTIVAIVVATFNPNDYKPMMIKLVQEKTQRTLAIPGDIKLTFFPKIGVKLGQLSISEHNRQEEFASVKRVELSLATMPLFAKRFVVDHVFIEGLNAQLKRSPDGSTNFDDLLSNEKDKNPQKQEPAQPIQFAIDRIKISDSTLRFDDRQQDRKLVIAGLHIDTGKIANGASSKFDIRADISNNRPVINAKLATESDFTFDLDRQHVVLEDLEGEIKGRLLDFSDAHVKVKGNADVKLQAKQLTLDSVALTFNGKQINRTIDAKIDLPKLALTDNNKASGKLTAVMKLTEGGQIIDSTLTTPLTVDLAAQKIDLPAVNAALSLPNPAGGLLKVKADGRAGVDLSKQSLSAALKGKLDDSAFDAKFGLTRFSSPIYTFDIGLDRIDTSRYQAKLAAPAPSAKIPAAAPAQEKPFDLSALKTLHATGSIKIGELKAANIKTTNVRMDVRANDGKINVNPLTANLYGGTLAGSLSATATNLPHFTMQQKLTGIAIGPLLKDATGKDPIEGQGNVQWDVTTQGATVNQMKKLLNGNAQLTLRDGAVRGINIAQTIRNAKATISALKGAPAQQTGAQNGPQTGTGSANEKTDFSELTGSFRIANGIAHNDDLAIKSPLLRIGGAGKINLGEDRLDYLIKTTVVSTLQGQGGPELQALKGVTVPVKLSGPFSAISWRIDFAGMASEAAKQKIEEKKEALKGKLEEQLKDKLKGLFGK